MHQVFLGAIKYERAKSMKLISVSLTVASGTLDEKGFALIDGMDPGTCQITFPQRDTEAWKKAE